MRLRLVKLMPNAGLCDMHGKKFVIGDFVLCARWTEVDGGMARVGAKHGAALVASMLRFGMKCGTFPDAHDAFGFKTLQVLCKRWAMGHA